MCYMSILWIPRSPTGYKPASRNTGDSWWVQGGPLDKKTFRANFSLKLCVGQAKNCVQSRRKLDKEQFACQISETFNIRSGLFGNRKVPPRVQGRNLLAIFFFTHLFTGDIIRHNRGIKSRLLPLPYNINPWQKDRTFCPIFCWLKISDRQICRITRTRKLNCFLQVSSWNRTL